MSRIIYYNKGIKAIDRILGIACIVFIVTWVYTRKSVSSMILLTLGVQRLLYAFNCYKLGLKRESTVSLAFGIVMIIPAILMQVGFKY